MASIQPFDVGDITAESVKKWTPSMVCKWVVSTAIDEDIGKHFVEHRQAWPLMHEPDRMLTEPSVAASTASFCCVSVLMI